MFFGAGESVDVIPYQQAAVDAYGDSTESYGPPVPYLCGVDPVYSSEPDAAGRNAVITGYTIFGPPGMVVGPHDHLTVRGGPCKVDGDVARRVNNFTGADFGVEFVAERVSG